MSALAAFTLHIKPPALICAAIFGYLLVMFTNPARTDFCSGWRALRRYRVLWVTLGTFGFCYALFQLALRVYFHAVLPPADRPTFVLAREAWRDPNYWLTGSPESLWWLPQAMFREVLRDSILPAVESVAGIFNNLVITFPLSAIAALLFLINWRGHHAVFLRALRKRLGPGAWGVHLLILVCAVSALGKPLLYFAPQLFSRWNAGADAALLWLQWGPVIASLSFVFEYLFGVCVQIHLILLAYAWVRGLNITHGHLLDFAIRRFSFVVKWAAIVLLLSTLLIDLPLILKNFDTFARFFPERDLLEWRLKIARAALATFLLLAATMQITLTFHNESWRQALRDHLRFVRRTAWTFGWFLLLALLHFYFLHATDLAMRRGLGEGTALWIGWTLGYPWLAAVMGAWLLASWVCLFKRCDTTRGGAENWIKF